jgi:hypothetical protein
MPSSLERIDSKNNNEIAISVVLVITLRCISMSAERPKKVLIGVVVALIKAVDSTLIGWTRKSNAKIKEILSPKNFFRNINSKQESTI